MKFLTFAVWLLLPVLASAQVQICSPQKIAALKASLPATVNGEWEKVFDDPLTFFYTDTEMPLTYQHADKGLLVGGSRIGTNPNTSFHSPRYNISGDAREASKGHGRGGNGNIEFPWRNPGGTDGGESNVRTFKFMRLPRKTPDSTEVWPVVWWTTALQGARTGTHYGYAWSFPVDTIFGECLCLRDSAGMLHTFEIRLRIRHRDFWDVEILRPFPTAASLAKKLRSDFLPRDDGEINNSIARELVSYLDTNRDIAEKSLLDRLHPTRIGFNAKAGVDPLPPMSEELVKHLLDNTPFDSAYATYWRKDSKGTIANSPTSDSNFGIVPKSYHGTFLGTTPDSCIKCHESTLMHVDQFDNQRDWYGYVRGSADGIFSFHPVDPGSISYNGASHGVAFRKSFIDSGMVERYNSTKHPESRYTLIKR